MDKEIVSSTIDKLEDFGENLTIREGMHFIRNVAQVNNNMLFHWMVNIPLPCWLKDLEGRMQYCNPAYYARFGVKGSEYRDKTDIEVWGKEVQIYNELDHIVCQMRKPFEAYEYVPVTNEKVKVLKWPIVNKEDKVIFVGGMVLDYKPIDIK